MLLFIANTDYAFAPAQMAAEIDANISSLVKTASVKDAALKGASFDMILTPSAGDALCHALSRFVTLVLTRSC
jgi:hypothetical protein